MTPHFVLDCVEITFSRKTKTRLPYPSSGKKVSLKSYSLECSELAIPGETNSEPKNDDSVPIRRLDEFRIFDLENNLVPFERLLSLDCYDGLQASGHVSTYIIDDSDSDEDDPTESLDPIPVHLPALCDVSLHHFETTHGCRGFDSNVYLLTEYAWYVLGVPHKSYTLFYKPFVISHAAMHFTLVQCLVDPGISFRQLRALFQAFLSSSDPSLFSEDYDLEPEQILGRSLTMDDFTQSEEYMQKTFVSWSQAEGNKILRKCGLARHPIVKHFVPHHLPNLKPALMHKDPIIDLPRQQRKKKAPIENTVVTQRVKHIAAAYGVGDLNNLLLLHQTFATRDSFQQAEQQAELRVQQKQKKIMQDHPETMYWISQSIGVDSEGHLMYNEVELEGEIFRAGDVVMVIPGDDDDQSRVRNSKSKASISANANMNHFWFCEIQYFFEDNIATEDPVQTMMFHARWFQAGAQLILQEAAHSQELILINECNDLHLSCIVQKALVKMLKPYEEIPEDRQDPACADYFCVYQTSSEGGFVDAAPCQQAFGCYSCNAKAEAACQEEPFMIQNPSGLSFKGYKIHQGDFVLLQQPGTIQLGVGWIYGISFKRQQVYLDVTYWSIGCDPLNQYYITPTTNMGSISATAIIRPCYVRTFTSHEAASTWCQDDHFYTIWDEAEGYLECCEVCLNARLDQIQRQSKLKRSLQPLSALELFAGCGGLGTGLIRSGLINTRWAVEIDASAALTFQVNHPDATVFAESVNVVLDNILQLHNGKKITQQLKNPYGEVIEPPKRGEVQVITAGAPCQSFSRANRHKKKEDVRSTLLCSFLSYVEHYDPKLAMIENVPGMLGHRFEREGEGGEINGGMIKFLYRSLMELGYQVNHKVLQAGQYGSPQSRQRVIFIAAKRGFPMPLFPTPTHAFPGGAHGFLQPDFTRLEPLTQFAPFSPITVNQAISDLPPFDWACPRQKKCHDKSIIQPNIPQLDTQSTPLVGYDRDMPYPTPPQNYYQKLMRAQEANYKHVTGHQTSRFKELVVERTVHVKLQPLADHRSLPENLKPSLGTDQQPTYRRLDGNGHFRTAMTVMNPHEVSAIRIHPTQHRVLSVREVARSQGFPDDYIFKAIPDDYIRVKYRQLGNAVPVPLATALGKALGEAYLAHVEQHNKEEEL